MKIIGTKKQESEMAMEFNYGLMARNTKDIGAMTWQMEKED